MRGCLVIIGSEWIINLRVNDDTTYGEGRGRIRHSASVGL